MVGWTQNDAVGRGTDHSDAERLHAAHKGPRGIEVISIKDGAITVMATALVAMLGCMNSLVTQSQYYV